ncbi:MAG: hypothetical protein SGBAC_007583 [Bacillariaceae sp.]
MQSILVYLLLFYTFVDGSTNLFDGYKKKSGLIADVPAAILSNEVEFPLIGLGVGNLQFNRVENMIYEGLKGENRIRLFDTSQMAGVDSEIIQGIKTGTKRFKEAEGIDDRIQVHLVTKIRHTYLGYQRTKLAVKSILQQYSPVLKDSNIDFRIHFLIHHPRCINGFDGMDCKKDEDELPAKVKRVGPAPHLGDGNAWKQSWLALEDLYTSDDYPGMSSIGVSNFAVEEMDELLALCSVKPHLVQMNISSLIEDTMLVNRCKAHDIHIQVFNVMERIVKNAQSTPQAYKSVTSTGNALSHGQKAVSPGQTILKWLTQKEISIIPRTHDLDHLSENSVGALARLSDISSNADVVLQKAVEAIHSGVDLVEDTQVQMSFSASVGDIFIYSYKENVVDQRHVAYVGKGDSVEIWANPNDTLRVYDAYNPKLFKDYLLLEYDSEDYSITVGLLR